LRRAQRELNLSGEQRERVEKIFSQSQERTKQLMEPVAPRLREELERAKLEFREILTPSQQTRFDELLKQRVRDQRREKGSRAHEKEAPVEPTARSTTN
jgi:Spy/CpxP family protein refolding chaperone